MKQESWAWCYRDARVGGNTWCAWAGGPGGVYFKRLDQLPSKVQSTIVNHYEDRRGMPFHVPLPIFESLTSPVFGPVP